MVLLAARPIPAASERRNTVAARVYEAIREAIVTAALKPGARISEADLAESLAVSRTPIREAFVRLFEEGLIEISPQTGTCVSRVGVERVRQAIFVRASLEGGAARARAAVPSHADLRRLGRLLEEQEAAIARGDFTEMYRQDMAFHATLMDAFGQPLAWSACQFVSADLARIGFLIGFDASHLEQIVREHRAILAAVEAADYGAAAAALEAHVSNIEIDRAALSERHADFFDPRPGA
jgi:DNA-binding GntR family transcriptional regulator